MNAYDATFPEIFAAQLAYDAALRRYREAEQELARATANLRGAERARGEAFRHALAGLTPSAPTKEEVQAGMTAKGGFTKAQLAAWGVPWPPPKGWREALEQRA